MMDKIAAFFGFEEEFSPVGSITAPLFLLMASVLILKVPALFNYDLLFVAILGLFLTAKWRVQGCVAALLLLAFSIAAKHVLVPTNHIWQAGLEGSVGIALFISALVFERSSKWAASKQSEMERNEKTILFLEEDLSQQKELTAQEIAAGAEKLAGLRIQLEEAESQVSALQVLNDVLRKAAAKSIEAKEAAELQGRMFDRREGLLLEEIDFLQKELNRLGNESALAQQNKQLFSELNESRLLEAQTHLINETLVRLHAKENQKVREFEGKFLALEEEMQHLLTQIANSDQALASMQAERNELKSEVELLQQRPAPVSEDLTAALAAQQTRLEQYAQVELLYRQLKVQFEEKNQILHQVRKELFRTDTELQTMKQRAQEKELDVNPVAKEVCLEMELLEEENALLREENDGLQELVSSLMNPVAATVERKMKGVPANQETLF